MGQIGKPQAVKLIAGFIFRQESAYILAKNLLENKFGKIDFESPAISFTHTKYYAREFGSPLQRRFVSFKDLILPQSLSKIKVITNKIELKLSKDSLRAVNIDPGYLNCAKLVLASAKDYSHRIYIGRGIYAELALFYKNGAFNPLDWTYSDYCTEEYLEIFNKIRTLYWQDK